jgi:hypothetical protein
MVTSIVKAKSYEQFLYNIKKEEEHGFKRVGNVIHTGVTMMQVMVKYTEQNP